MPHPSSAPASAWPLFDLVVRTPRLTLRPARDEDLAALVELVRAGVRDPEQPVFLFDWDLKPEPALAREFLQFHWGLRANWSAASWGLEMAVLDQDGEPIGMQGIYGRDFAARRTVLTGSWLGRAHQGRGYGTEMRAGALALAFDGLGAIAAESGHLDGNHASRRVSEKLGYQPNGMETVAPRGEPMPERRVRLERAAWSPPVPVVIEGLDACRDLFGAA